MKLERLPYGTTAAGEKIDSFLVSNGEVAFRALNYGATLASVESVDRTGKPEELTLGFNAIDGWEGIHPYFGATVGRFANRIAGALFTLDGTEYPLYANNGPNHLHGGKTGFNRHLWDGFPFQNEKEAGVKFSRTSPDGEEGYPGNLDVTVTFSLSLTNELTISYEAVCDKATIINLTNHSYWNLDGSCGKSSILEHELTLFADSYVEVDAEAIPTGRLPKVGGGPFDFTNRKPVGRDIEAAGGYDHCYLLRAGKSDEPQLAAELYSPKSGRVMKVYATQPGIQLYTGNFLDGSLLQRDGIPAAKHSALCLETETFPDAPNRPEFPTAVLRPGERYREKTIHHFSLA